MTPRLRHHERATCCGRHFHRWRWADGEFAVTGQQCGCGRLLNWTPSPATHGELRGAGVPREIWPLLITGRQVTLERTGKLARWSPERLTGSSVYLRPTRNPNPGPVHCRVLAADRDRLTVLVLAGHPEPAPVAPPEPLPEPERRWRDLRATFDLVSRERRARLFFTAPPDPVPA